MRFGYGYVSVAASSAREWDPLSRMSRASRTTCYLDGMSVCIAGAGAGGKN